MDIKENIQRIAATLPAGVQLIAVSKTKPAEAIEEVYVWGQRAFGETARRRWLPNIRGCLKT